MDRRHHILSVRFGIHTSQTEYIFLLFKKYVRSNFHGWHNIQIGGFVFIVYIVEIWAEESAYIKAVLWSDGRLHLYYCLLCIGLDACRVTHKRKTSTLVHLIRNGIFWQSDIQIVSFVRNLACLLLQYYRIYIVHSIQAIYVRRIWLLYIGFRRCIYHSDCIKYDKLLIVIQEICWSLLHLTFKPFIINFT